MKNGVVENISGTPTAEQLEAINRFTRRTLKAEEDYVFSVVLCDNEVDRDNERFTVKALEKLKELFVGKTGIFDHSHTAKNQCARIFGTELLFHPEKITAAGDNYCQLKAYAYTVRSKENLSLITDIDAGIKKEVSIGCSVLRRVCSVCGQNIDSCSHRKGKTYFVSGVNKKCFAELCEPNDAYEWSFVAVPAQPAAGVTKSFEGREKMSTEDLIKSFDEMETVELSKAQAEQIKKDYLLMKSLNNAAKEYLEVQKGFIIKNLCKNMDRQTVSVIEAVLGRMTAEELFELYKNTEKAADTVTQQIKKQTKKQNKNINRDFIV